MKLLNYINPKYKNKDIKLLISNFFNLAIVQGLDLILPLLTIPYTTRVLGFQKLGIIAFAVALVGYFGIIINYGFNLTATKQVSQNRESVVDLRKIYSQVTFSKMILIILSLIIFLIFIIFIPKVSEEKTLFFFSFLSVIFSNLIPYWLFQGIQDLKYTTRLTTVFKILSTASIFIFVKKVDDYLIIAILPLITNFLVLVIIQFVLYKKYNIYFVKTTFREIIDQLNKGFYIFLSQIKISFFTNFNTIVVGSILGDTAVGLFSSAEKIIRILSSVQIPIVSSLFPYFSKKIHENRREAFIHINKIAKIGAGFYFIICSLVFILSPYIAYWIFGSQVHEISILIRIMVFNPIFVFANNMFGTQFLLNIGKDKRFTLNLIFAALVNVVLIFPLIYLYNVYGAAISVLITEILVYVLMHYFAIKNFQNQ